jgi:cephalosporin-C deacetylase-like acetyl esterase
MVQDVRRGIDLLWADPQIDHDRIIVIGAVAGGGDLAAVAGALDDRVAAVVAFNLGHLSTGDWDSTRNLADTAQLGF